MAAYLALTGGPFLPVLYCGRKYPAFFAYKPGRQEDVGGKAPGGDTFQGFPEPFSAHQPVGGVDIADGVSEEHPDHDPGDIADALPSRRGILFLALGDEEIIVLAVGPKTGKGRRIQLMVGIDLEDPVDISTPVVAVQDGGTVTGV